MHVEKTKVKLARRTSVIVGEADVAVIPLDAIEKYLGSLISMGSIREAELINRMNAACVFSTNTRMYCVRKITPCRPG